jgi:hypothetical protein
MINKNNTYHPCLNTLGFGAKPQLNFSVCEANTLTWFYANKEAGSRYFCESLFWASQPKQAAKT